jgi:POT family proton-dependent oligopeptide transporter
VVLGASLMSAGHFSLAFEQSFLLALLLLIVGAGCVRGNLTSPRSGDLYAKDDGRRADGIQIYYAMVYRSVFIAPIVSGILGQRRNASHSPQHVRIMSRRCGDYEL